MRTENLGAVRNSSAPEAARLPDDRQTAGAKKVSEKKILYLAKKYSELKFEKIKRAISSLIYGKEISTIAYANKIHNIKQKISNAKSRNDASEYIHPSASGTSAVNNNDRTQNRESEQKTRVSPDERDSRTQNGVSHQQITGDPSQTTVIQQPVVLQQLVEMQPASNTQPLPYTQQQMVTPQQNALQYPIGMQQQIGWQQVSVPQQMVTPQQNALQYPIGMQQHIGWQQVSTPQQMVTPQQNALQYPIGMQQQGWQPISNAPTPFQGMMATPAIPPYVTTSALPQAKYFLQYNWYSPMPPSASTPQSTMASTRPDFSEGRRLPNTRFTETSAGPVRQNYRLGNAPDRTIFYGELSKEVKKQLAPLSRMTTTQKLHVLSHMMYSEEIPNYPDEKMKSAAFELINKIEQLRLDYVPNANDGSPNIYKVIFNNLLRNDIVETLPKEIREKFVAADEKYQESGDFEELIGTFRNLISDAQNETSGTASTERRQAKPGELTSEWMAKMNQSLSPYREQIENWSDLDKYQAMLYLLRGDQEEFSDNIKVQAWVAGIGLIRQLDIHDANDYSKRNEQKVFFNNNLRTVLKNNLPEDFQKKFDAINENFQRMGPSSQENTYETYLENIRAIVREEIKKLPKT